MSNEAYLLPETGWQVQLATSGDDTWTSDSCCNLAVDVGSPFPYPGGDNSHMSINLVTPFADKDAALEEIETGRGIKFDAVIVDACLKLFREKAFQIPA